MRESEALNPRGSQEIRRHDPDSATSCHGKDGQGSATTENRRSERPTLDGPRYCEGKESLTRHEAGKKKAEMKPATVLLSLCFAISVLAQTPQTQPPQPPPTKRLFIADYIITGVFGSAQTTYGSTVGGAAVVGRNISLEATDGFIKNCPAVTVTSDQDAADYTLRPNKGSSTLYKKNGDVVYVSHAKVKVSNLVKDVCGYIKSH